MMNRWLEIIIVCTTLLLPACATLEKPQVTTIDKQPKSSSVLTATPERFLKRKVAIGRFTNETKYGQSYFLDANNDVIGKQAMDILSAKLAATDKFILLERADIDKINKELKMGDNAHLSIPADFLIIGSISEFGRKEVSDVGLFSRVLKQKAYAKVSIRLVDVYTGQIIYSAEGDGEAFSEAGSIMGVGARAGYDSTLNDKAISAAIAKVINTVIENLLERPWRSYILAYENGNYVIAGGAAQGLRKDDLYGVYRKGKRVKNPQTGMMIDLPGHLSGTIKVDATAGNGPGGEISFCSLVNGAVPTDNFSEFYVQEINQK